MNTYDLETYLKGNPVTKQVFNGVYASDQLPPKHGVKPCLYIANTDPSHMNGEHWVVIFFPLKGLPEYFDPLGMPPLRHEFKRLLGDEWLESKEMVQHPFSINCGWHCLFYACMRCYGFYYAELMTCYTTDLMFNDNFVKEFCSIIF